MLDTLFTNDELTHPNPTPASPPLPLPPAGDARRDELAKRTDALEQKAETQYADRGAIPHDHNALRPDRNREIQDHIHKSHLEIGTDHPFYVVKWVNYRNQDGHMVWDAKSKGWQVATIKDFPEAQQMGLVREDNTLRVGDVMLMFIRKDEHLKIEQREKEKRLRQQFGVEAEIHNLAQRHSGIFAGAVTPELGTSGNMSQSSLKHLEKMEAKSAARRVAAQHIGNRMRQGPIPGLPIK